MNRLWLLLAVAALVLCIVAPDVVLAFGGGSGRN